MFLLYVCFFHRSRLLVVAGFQGQIRQSSGQQRESDHHFGGDLRPGGWAVLRGRGFYFGHPLPETDHSARLRQQGGPSGVGHPSAVQPR